MDKAIEEMKISIPHGKGIFSFKLGHFEVPDDHIAINGIVFANVEKLKDNLSHQLYLQTNKLESILSTWLTRENLEEVQDVLDKTHNEIIKVLERPKEW